MTRIAVLVKQVPVVEAMALGDGARLCRSGVALEMNAYCRRAVAAGVGLARPLGGTCTVVTLGPPSAEDVLREAVAFGADRGVLVTDPQLAGSDTLATARALEAALRRLGPWDLVLLGRNSIDADTGQVGPELAELLGLPFVAAVRRLEVQTGDGSTVATVGAPAGEEPPTAPGPPPAPLVVAARSELDDGWRDVRVPLPVVVSVAERLTDPCKRSPEDRAAVAADRLERLAAADLGPGPWGAAASPTVVTGVRTLAVPRRGERLGGPATEQVDRAVAVLTERGVLPVGAGRSASPRGAATSADGDEAVPSQTGRDGPRVAVVVEPGRPGVTRELLGEAAQLASDLRGHVLAVGPEPGAPGELAGWGADSVPVVASGPVEEDVARALADRWADRPPWAVLVPGTLWGREVAARLAARSGAGLTGDAVRLGVAGDRLVCAKPAFGGRLVAEVVGSSATQLATVRPGVLRRRVPRPAAAPVVERWPARPRGRVEVTGEGRDSDVGDLVTAPAIVCVGQAVAPEDYPLLDPLVEGLGAVVGATRKVTDRGWLPRSRQIGITGRSVAPELLVLVGVGGSTNHMVATTGSGTVVAVNSDEHAPVFDWCDVGLVGDWREVVPLLAIRIG